MQRSGACGFPATPTLLWLPLTMRVCWTPKYSTLFDVGHSRTILLRPAVSSPVTVLADSSLYRGALENIDPRDASLGIYPAMYIKHHEQNTHSHVKIYHQHHNNDEHYECRVLALECDASNTENTADHHGPNMLL